MAAYIKRLMGWQRKGAAPITQGLGGLGLSPLGTSPLGL